MAANNEYGEGRPSIPAIDAPVIIVMINKAFGHNSEFEDDVYRAARCCWVIGEEARNRAKYVLAASNGVVRGAWRIVDWMPAGDKRWRFDGMIASELAVVGTSIARIKASQGASNPVRHFPHGIPPE